MNDLDWVDLVQWPAMAATSVAAYLVAAKDPRERQYGFACYIGSNILWMWWGWHDGAYSLILLQAILFALNLRGSAKAGELRENAPPVNG